MAAVKRGLIATLTTIAMPAQAQEDLRPSAVHAKYNASNKVLLCPSARAMIEGYRLAGLGRSFAATRCTVVPDQAVVMIDCRRSNRNIARIRFGGRAGYTSAEQLDESCAPRR